jgi:hypothetical protein
MVFTKTKSTKTKKTTSPEKKVSPSQAQSQPTSRLTQKELKQVYDIVTNDLFDCFQQMEIGQSVKLGALGVFKKTAREFDLVDSDGQRHTGSYYHFGFKMFKSVRQQLQD